MSKAFHHINWVDGMKINKDHFLQNDLAFQYDLQGATALSVNPHQYGLLPQWSSGKSYEISISADNQNTISVSINHLQAITLAGHRIAISHELHQANDEQNRFIFNYSRPDSPSVWWIALMIHPYERVPFGTPISGESPPRLPYLRPHYSVELVTAQSEQVINNPSALIIGKLWAGANEVTVDNDFIPPCFATAAHSDLTALAGELDSFYSGLEQKSTIIVQKILQKKQENELAELVQFVCDRLLLHLSSTITSFRWGMQHHSPSVLIASVAALARVIKNAMDMRLGSGKEEMMNYLVEWSELKQGELDAMLTEMATMRYVHHDVNTNISGIIRFVSILSKLFDTLSKLEFIGKKKDTGYFVNEQPYAPEPSFTNEVKPKRRFFG